jgi:glutathione S-transferase
MKIYGHPQSSCTRKVLITLAEKGAFAEFQLVDLFSGEHKKTAHLTRQPFGVVPALDDDGFMLYESRAIIRYLDSRLEGPPLQPEAELDRARMDQWLSVDQSYIAPHTRTLALERIVKKHDGLPEDRAATEMAETGLARSFAVIDRALEGKDYLVGKAFSLADISLMPYVASLGMIGAEHLLEDRAHLTAWWERMRERASWKRATATRGES